MNSIHQEISSQIKDFQPGVIVFPTDFRGLGTDDAIRQALSRLTKEGRIERLAHGIYFLPNIHPTFGKLYPSMEEVANAVAANEHMRIKPAGAYALNKLGLSTQVPARLVYITDGQARQITIGKGGVKFKPVSPKKFGMKGPISSLLIQGLEEMNISQITPNMEERIKQLLNQETMDNLYYDLKLAPARINDFIVKLLKYPLNGRVA
ncbi:DUF6088 family protein [Mucilaginibacter sp. UYCu711]|uniref:DUF6088 family protein n=1 Tax=Mucilaginibacter sp. UYCu711 TaxID=3156339 RepID=UPI003D1CE986